MRKNSIAYLLAVVVMISSICGAASPAVWGSDDENAVAMVTGIKKGLTVVHNGGSVPGTVGMDLFVGDTLRTGAGCQAVLMLGDGSEIKLNENTEITLKEFSSQRKSIFVKIGEIFGKFLPQPTKVIFETPKGIAGIEGTEFNLKVDHDEGQLTVNEGVVAVSDEENPDKTVKVSGDCGCNFRKGTITLPVKTQFPQWGARLRAYNATLDELQGCLKFIKNRGDITTLSEEDLAGKIETVKNLEDELKDALPPGQMAKFHEGLSGLNADAIKTLNLALDVKKNPGNKKLRQEYENSAKMIKQKIITYIPQIGQHYETMKTRIDTFKKAHGQKLTPEQREKLNERHKLTPEQREKLKEHQKLTPEQREKLKEHQKLTPEQREKLKESYDKLTPEQKAKLKEKYDTLTPEQKAKLKEGYDKLTPEQKAKLKEHPQLTPEQKAKLKEHPQLTPEQRTRLREHQPSPAPSAQPK